MKNYFVPIVVGLVLLLSIVQAFQINALRSNSAPQVTSAAVTTNAQAGETYEQMMARMHPDQVSAQPAPQASASPSMVGGC